MNIKRKTQKFKLRMDRKIIIEKVQEIFRDIFDDDNLVINDDTSASDIDNWDSLNQINVISAIEIEFNIKFMLADLNKLDNVSAIIQLIESKIN